MSYLFWYMVICYIAAWCAAHIDPLGPDGEASLIEEGEFTKQEIECAFKVALIPVVNIYAICVYVSLSVKPIKKSILLRVKRMIEEAENE